MWGSCRGPPSKGGHPPPTCDTGRGPWRWRWGPRSSERGPRSRHLMVSRPPGPGRQQDPPTQTPWSQPPPCAPHTCDSGELLALPSTGFLPDDGGDTAQRRGWAHSPPASPAPPPGSGHGPGLSAPFRPGSPLAEPATRPAGARAKGPASGAPLPHSSVRVVSKGFAERFNEDSADATHAHAPSVP